MKLQELRKESNITQEKLAMLEKMLERVENMRLLKLAESRVGGASVTFEDFVAEEGFSMEELTMLAECVEFE